MGDGHLNRLRLKNPVHGQASVFVEVEVDTETGQVEVTKLVHPYDVGQSINPDVNDQQLYGGAYQGVGVSATEAIYYDPRTGVKLNDNLIGYPILTILDMGSIETPIVETSSRLEYLRTLWLQRSRQSGNSRRPTGPGCL